MSVDVAAECKKDTESLCKTSMCKCSLADSSQVCFVSILPALRAEVANFRTCSKPDDAYPSSDHQPIGLEAGQCKAVCLATCCKKGCEKSLGRHKACTVAQQQVLQYTDALFVSCIHLPFFSSKQTQDTRIADTICLCHACCVRQPACIGLKW